MIVTNLMEITKYSKKTNDRGNRRMDNPEIQATQGHAQVTELGHTHKSIIQKT